MTSRHSRDCIFFYALRQNFQDLMKSACNRDPKADKAGKGPKKLSSDTSSRYLLQSLQNNLISQRTNSAHIQNMVWSLMHSCQELTFYSTDLSLTVALWILSIYFVVCSVGL